MILPALVGEFGSLFAREPRAGVALWFDEKREFERLLEPLATHLASLPGRPFALLRYDPAASHGQLWLKAQVHWTGRDLPEGRRIGRHVLYLPFAPERLTEPDEDGWAAEFLLEYAHTGVTWAIDGKKPTLFSFLRKLGLQLPDEQKEQRRLWEGGCDSLLARVAGKHAHQGAAFWGHPITASWAQAQVLGDVEQTLLDVAGDPVASWARLREQGLLDDLLARVRGQYGFAHEAHDPQEWVAAFALHLAQAECYQAYAEPADFPFQDRLPGAEQRGHCVQMLNRWLRDVSARDDYDRLIAAQEEEHNLGAWAQGRAGLSFGFPHLARHRWQTLYAEFRAAAGRKDAYLPLLRDRREQLAREAEHQRASGQGLAGFDLLRRLAELVLACEEACGRARQLTRAEDLAALYVEMAERVDRAHWRLCCDAHKQVELEEVVAVAERAYGEYLEAINGAFFASIRERADFALAGIPGVREGAAALWARPRPLAVVMIDALRYDCAIELRHRLRLPGECLEPWLGCIPSRTWAGMSSLLPLEGVALQYQPTGGGEGRLRVAGTRRDLGDRKDRLALLQEKTGAVCKDIDEVDQAAKAPKSRADLLVVYGHRTIDDLGHASASVLVRYLNDEVARLERLVRKLHSWGYPEVHLVTDHGFVLVSDEVDVREVPSPAGQALLVKPRYAVLAAGAVVEAKTFPFPLDPSFRLAFPPGLACFRKDEDFTHGGLTLQEVIIPHLVSRQEGPVPRIEVLPVLSTYEIRTHMVKVVLEPVLPAAELFSKPTGRKVSVDLQRGGQSVLVRVEERELEADPEKKVPVVLKLSDKVSFRAEDRLDLVVRDVDNQEVLSPPGLKLTVARNL